MATESYRTAGVDVENYEAWLSSLSKKLPGIGGFSGIFPLGKHIAGMNNPCLVASTDGVGTKLLVARAVGDLSTVGIDCVAMVVNDIICCGAKPILFLDYYAVGKFSPAEADAVLEGLRRGCELTGCDLIGGETAELPGLLQPGDFDIAGFGVGVVDQSRVVDGSTVKPGDVVIGLPSTGIHSNGLSLARKVLPEYVSDEGLARELLVPTALYVSPVLRILEAVRLKAIAHITGEGIPGNLCRVLPPGVDARLDPTLWSCPPIFGRIAARGVSHSELFHTFNMGLGMCLVVAPEDARAVLEVAGPEGACRVGEIVPGKGDVQIEGVTL